MRSPVARGAALSGIRIGAAPLAVGLGIGLLLCVLNVLILFKTGQGFGGSALVVILGALLLRSIRALTWHHLFIVFSVASSGYFATAAIDSGAAAVFLQTGSLPPWLLMVAAA